jgi:hypothetical protein
MTTPQKLHALRRLLRMKGVQSFDEKCEEFRKSRRFKCGVGYSCIPLSIDGHIVAVGYRKVMGQIPAWGERHECK